MVMLRSETSGVPTRQDARNETIAKTFENGINGPIGFEDSKHVTSMDKVVAADFSI